MTSPGTTVEAFESVASESAPRRFDPFRVLSRRERLAELEYCLESLAARDGEVDFPARSLSRREAFMEELARDPVVHRAPIDTDAFFQYFDETGTPETDERTLWLVTVAKMNENESYGAAGELDRHERLGLEGIHQGEVLMALEEQYHGRMLVEACRCLGIDVTLRRPRRLMRFFIHLMVYLPSSLRYVPILCGEAMGCIVFRRLAEMSHWLVDDPQVQERMRRLFHEILVDETLHVLYCRARLAPITLRLCRLLAPIVAFGLLWGVTPLRKLGVTTAGVMRAVREGIELPHELDASPAEQSRG